MQAAAVVQEAAASPVVATVVYSGGAGSAAASRRGSQLGARLDGIEAGQRRRRAQAAARNAPALDRGGERVEPRGGQLHVLHQTLRPHVQQHGGQPSHAQLVAQRLILVAFYKQEAHVWPLRRQLQQAPQQRLAAAAPGGIKLRPRGSRAGCGGQGVGAVSWQAAAANHTTRCNGAVTATHLNHHQVFPRSRQLIYQVLRGLYLHTVGGLGRLWGKPWRSRLGDGAAAAGRTRVGAGRKAAAAVGNAHLPPGAQHA